MKDLRICRPPEKESAPENPPTRMGREPLRLRKGPSQSEKGHDLWLLTLSDLLLVLLIFFVLLFATLQQQPEAAHAPAPETAAAVEAEERPVEAPPDQALEATSGEKLSSLETDLRTTLGEEAGTAGLTVTRTADHLVLTFPERIAFDPGRAELKLSAEPILDKVALLALAHPDFFMEVQGHTDDRPINTRRYPSNWELSVDRATQVARALISLGFDPARITVKGYGEYRPLFPNEGDLSRQKNRRVEIQFSLPPQS
jgi:chemotaxis protein MotB